MMENDTGAPRDNLGKKRRIMIVDDEEDICKIFKSGLERHGFAVDSFQDPIDALARYKPDFYDLLLIDIRMPRISGFELLREILKVDPKVKTVFISATEVHTNEVTKALPQGIKASIVKKPIPLKNLVKLVQDEILD